MSNALQPERQAPAPSMRDAVRYQYYDTSDDRIILFQASERHFFERFCRAVGREDLLEGDLGEEFGEHASGDLELRRAAGRDLRHSHPARVGRLPARGRRPGRARASCPRAPRGSELHRPGRHRGARPSDRRTADACSASPIKTDAPHGAHGPRAASTGDHSDEILSSVLGYDAARIAQLRESGTVE